MKLKEFDFHLPQELIAQTPLEPRDRSRMLVLHRPDGRLEHRHFYDLPSYLRPGDALVLNDTRVMPARLHGQKAGSGAQVEVLLLKRLDRDRWEALVRPGKRLRPGARITFGTGLLRAQVLEETDFGGRVLEFAYAGTFETVLERLGEMPLPPYIKARLDDPERYQTVYARNWGAAAAPTAGLHFTPELLKRLTGQGVGVHYLTLHVGLGTFRPVEVEEIEQHKLHSEWYHLPGDVAAALTAARARGGRIVAVGTTAVRTLESVAAACGGRLQESSGWTDIFIYPGYRYQAVDALITNFHLPKSSLLMLVSAFASLEQLHAAYRAAVDERYRFFSFGDAMLIL